VFEKELSEKFKAIFDVGKVTFDTPSLQNSPGTVTTREQECIFINVQTAKNTFKSGQVLAMVTGSAIMIARSEKLPFGFFSKAIANAPLALTKDLFFYDFESNSAIFRDVVQRSFSFVYFFRGQFDPDVGTMTSVDLTLEEST
jgi:hypothetical protein